MVSKVELLELLLKYGPFQLKKLREMFGSEIYIIVKKLRIQGLVQAYIYELDKERFEYVKRILKPNEHKKNIIIELSPKAYEYLHRLGVDSFYKTPMAERSKTLLVIRNDFIKLG